MSMERLFYLLDERVTRACLGSLPDEGTFVHPDVVLARAQDGGSGELPSFASRGVPIDAVLEDLLRRRARTAGPSYHANVRLVVFAPGWEPARSRLQKTLMEASDALLDRLAGTLRVYVDVVCLLPTLLDDPGDAGDHNSLWTEVKRVSSPEGPRFRGFYGCDVWCIDGFSKNGRLFSLEQVLPPLARLFSATPWREDALPRTGVGIATVGFMSIRFPKQEVFRLLAARFGSAALSMQVWIAGELPHISSVLGWCEGFVKSNVVDFTSELMRDDDGSLVDSPPAMPDVEISAPVEVLEREFESSLARAIEERLGVVQSVLSANCARLATRLDTALRAEIDSILDESPHRAVEALAFCELVAGDTSNEVTGEYDGPTQALLERILGPALEFFDAECAALDPSDTFRSEWRHELVDLKQRLMAQRAYVERLRERLEAESGGAESRPDARVRYQEIEQQIATAETEIEEMDNKISQYQAAVTQRDMLLENPSRRRTLKRSSLSALRNGLAEYRQNVAKAHAGAKEAEQRLHEAKTAWTRVARRYIAAFFSIAGSAAAITAIVLLALSSAAAGVGGVLGSIVVLITTAVGTAAAPFLIWGALGAAAAYLLLAARGVFDALSRARAASAALDAAQAALSGAVRASWNRHAEIFQKEVQWLTFGQLFDLHSEVESCLAERSALLREFIRAVRAVADSGVACRLAEPANASESIVVNDVWLDGLVEERQEIMKGKAGLVFDQSGLAFHELLQEFEQTANLSSMHERFEQVVRREVFPELQDKTVCDILVDAEIDLDERIRATDVLLRLTPDSRDAYREVWFLVGPSERCLKESAMRLSPRGILSHSTDEEVIDVVRTAYEIPLDRILALRVASHTAREEG